MERKIGEIFEYNGEWYQCICSSDCSKCDLKIIQYCRHKFPCESLQRNDCEEVIFKKLEKVGEPYMTGNKLIQRYKIYPTTCCINVYGWYYQNLDVKSWTIDIELKQTKEDMEEKNLKPFDLEAAKAGKFVCTRDGRKARIVCFDKADERPIVALISDNGSEFVYEYLINGKCYKSKDDSNDLMMLHEKKEGWVNIYRDIDDNTPYTENDNIYSSRYKAKESAKMINMKTYIDTIKISWEE